MWWGIIGILLWACSQGRTKSFADWVKHWSSTEELWLWTCIGYLLNLVWIDWTFSWISELFRGQLGDSSQRLCDWLCHHLTEITRTDMVTFTSLSYPGLKICVVHLLIHFDNESIRSNFPGSKGTGNSEKMQKGRKWPYLVSKIISLAPSIAPFFILSINSLTLERKEIPGIFINKTLFSYF